MQLRSCDSFLIIIEPDEVRGVPIREGGLKSRKASPTERSSVAAAGVTAAGIAGTAGIGMAVAAAEPAAAGIVLRGSGVDGGLRVEGRIAAEVSLGDFRAHGVVMAVLARLPVMVVEVLLRTVDAVGVAEVIRSSPDITACVPHFFRGIVALATEAALERGANLPDERPDRSTLADGCEHGVRVGLG